MQDRKAVILENHGMLTREAGLAHAYNILEKIEHCSEIYIRAKAIGEPVVLVDEEMEKRLINLKHMTTIKGIMKYG